MAKISGVCDGIRGKAGSVVFSNWNGLQVLRSLVIPRARHTSAQTAQRTTLSIISSVFSEIQEKIIKPIWKPLQLRRSNYWNNFLSTNLLLTGNSFDASKIIITKGILECICSLEIEYSPTYGRFYASWSTKTFTTGSDSDRLSFVVFDTIRNEIVQLRLNAVARSSSSSTFTYISGHSAAQFIVYAFVTDGDFASGDFSMASVSQAITVAPH